MRKPRLGSIYKPKRLLLETLVGYCAAANNTTPNQFTRGENARSLKNKKTLPQGGSEGI